MTCQFLSGGVGYLAQFITEPWLVLSGENAAVGAFWTGDTLAGVFTLLLALLQSPDAETPNFSPSVYMIILTATLPIALVFCCVCSNSKFFLNSNFFTAENEPLKVCQK